MDQYISKKVARDMTGASFVTQWRWRRTGLIPPLYRLGPNKVAYKLSEIENWIASRKPTTAKAA